MKVLIISHNPITTYHNMGKTILSLFSEFDKKELCQLYIYPTIPNIDACNSYYRITDKDVLKAYYKFKALGRKIENSEIDNNSVSMFEKASDEKIYRNTKNKKPAVKFARDLMWKFSRWFNNDLKKWLLKEMPTCIFVAPGNSSFFYDIAFKCSKFLKIPIVTYICDEYYFARPNKSLLDNLYNIFLRKKIKKLVNKSDRIITICDELTNLYKNHFNIAATTIMTGTSYDIEKKQKRVLRPTSITYMGNIRCNRFNSLRQVGEKLDYINKLYKTNYKLEIYSNEKDSNILKSFENIESIEFKGFVSGKEYERIFKKSEVLMHTEAFDKYNKEIVKYSISTKIADCLGSGICLFAYGPRGVASIDYLISNDCAVSVTSENDLIEGLEKLFNDEKYRNTKVENALKLAASNHNKKNISKKLYSNLKEL